MWRTILLKIENSQKFTKAESSEFEKLINQVKKNRFYKDNKNLERKKDCLAEAVAEFLKYAKSGNYLNNISNDSIEKQNEQIKSYFYKSIDNNFSRHFKDANEDTANQVDLFVEGEDGQQYENPKIEIKNEDHEFLIECRKMRDDIEIGFNNTVNYIEKEDGLKGEIKIINFMSNDNIVNDGCLARNFALFLPWQNSEYTYKSYINYVKAKTGEKINLTTSTEQERWKKIWENAFLFCSKEKNNDFISYFASIFKNYSAIKFYERKPEILEGTSFNDYVDRFFSEEI